jgi:hypothetical protein
VREKSLKQIEIKEWDVKEEAGGEIRARCKKKVENIVR